MPVPPPHIANQAKRDMAIRCNRIIAHLSEIVNAPDEAFTDEKKARDLFFSLTLARMETKIAQEYFRGRYWPTTGS